MKDRVSVLEGSALWMKFNHDFLQMHGTHILGLGQTGTGKTRYKGFIVNKWLMNRGKETLYILDCGKPGEVLPYASFGRPLNFIVPMGCEIRIEGSPVPITINYAATPEESWDYVEKDQINIFTFRYHTLDPVVKGLYMSRFVEVLINQVMRQTIEIPLPGVLDIDECSDVIGGDRLWEEPVYQRITAARITTVLKKIRFIGLRLHCKDQAWADVYAPARRQFPFLLLSRSPGTRGKTDIGRVSDYSFDSLKVNQAVMVFPVREWRGVWSDFKRIDAPEGMTIRYYGEVVLDRKPRRTERLKAFEGVTPEGLNFVEAAKG